MTFILTFFFDFNLIRHLLYYIILFLVLFGTVPLTVASSIFKLWMQITSHFKITENEETKNLLLLFFICSLEVVGVLTHARWGLHIIIVIVWMKKNVSGKSSVFCSQK